MLTSLVLVCYVGTFCARSILYRCGVLFIVVKATPNAYFLVNEHLHTFFFLQPLLGMLGTQTIYYMKTRNLLFAAFLLAFGAAACESTIETPETPNEEAKTFTVKLSVGGEVDVTHEPLTRFTPDDRDLYGVQVRHKPATTGSYEHYAYGLFDNVEDMSLEVTENYQYEITVKLIDDGKDKIYCDSILVDSNYYLGYDKPFQGLNKYNGSTSTSITQLTNKFTYASDRYFYSNSQIRLKDGKAYTYPENIDFYYGQINNYIPTEDGTVLSIYLKHMVTGLKINIGDYFDNGKITLSAFSKNYTFTPDSKTYETTFANYDTYSSWYTREDLSQSYFNATLDFKWVKDDGTVVDWKSFDSRFYRLKQTVINLQYYGEDEVIGSNTFDVHYEDTEMEKDYHKCNYGSEQDDYNW